MKRLPRLGSLTGAIVLCTVLTLSNVAVADNKVTPGAMCQNTVASTFGNPEPFRGEYFNYFIINGASLMTVACPIWRASNSSTLDHVWVRVENLQAEPLFCWVFSQDGGSNAYSQTGSQSLSGVGTASLHFATDGLQHYGGGSFAVRCNLGEYGSVRSIRTQE